MQEIFLLANQHVWHVRKCPARGWKLFQTETYRIPGWNGGSLLRTLPFLFANSVHDVSYDRLYLIRRESKRVTVRNETDGLASTVHDHLAGLAFPQVFFEVGSHLGAGRPF